MGAIRPGAKLQIDGKNYVVDRELDGDEWQLEDMVSRRIHTYTLIQLRILLEEQRLTFLRAIPLPGNGSAVIKFEIDEALREEAKVRRMYVKAVEGLALTSPLYKDVIARLWNQKKVPVRCPHPVTVHHWRNRYQSADGNIAALVTQTHRKGNRKARYPEECEVLMQQAIDEVYLTRQQRTVKATWERAAYLLIKENKLRPAIDQLPLPSWRAIKNRIEAIPAYDREVARKGRDSARNTFRSSMGHFDVARPLSLAEIDHTLLDIVVTDDKTGHTLGRPYMTICVDVYSRAVLGLHIGFNPPSFLTVASCLRHAVLPKERLRDLYPDIRNSWFSHGVMDVISVDNGPEFHSDSFEQACFALNIDINYAPRKTGYAKPIVERIIGHINQGLIHSMPGTTFSNIAQKGDYNPVKNATVRIGKLRQIISYWICDVYHREIHRTLRTTPYDAWTRNISTVDINYPDSSIELNAVLGWRLKRQLTHKGIEYMGLFYNSTELSNLRRRLGAELTVEVRIDQDNIGCLIVISPKSGQPIVVPALRSEYAEGMCLYQHKVCRKYARRYLGGEEIEQLIVAKQKIFEYIEEERAVKKRINRTRVKEARYLAGRGNRSERIADSGTSVKAIQKVSRDFVDELFEMERPEVLGVQYRNQSVLMSAD
jgi:putative transposase